MPERKIIFCTYIIRIFAKLNQSWKCLSAKIIFLALKYFKSLNRIRPTMGDALWPFMEKCALSHLERDRLCSACVTEIWSPHRSALVVKSGWICRLCDRLIFQLQHWPIEERWVANVGTLLSASVYCLQITFLWITSAIRIMSLLTFAVQKKHSASVFQIEIFCFPIWRYSNGFWHSKWVLRPPCATV